LFVERWGCESWVRPARVTRQRKGGERTTIDFLYDMAFARRDQLSLLRPQQKQNAPSFSPPVFFFNTKRVPPASAPPSHNHAHAIVIHSQKRSERIKRGSGASFPHTRAAKASRHKKKKTMPTFALYIKADLENVKKLSLGPNFRFCMAVSLWLGGGCVRGASVHFHRPPP
jgi:hypothetical protein